VPSWRHFSLAVSPANREANPIALSHALDTVAVHSHSLMTTSAAPPSSPFSPSASSSAVTIPTPGKSILKRPPPAQQSFFSISRLSKFLPNQQANAATNTTANGEVEPDDRRALKRAHFILPQLSTVYPISSSNPPSMPGLRDEKVAVEQRESERRRRIMRANSITVDTAGGASEDYWSMDKVESFYRECCESREEFPHPPISAALKVRITKYDME
jgi:protein phosphatase 1 regulatory subunit 37